MCNRNRREQTRSLVSRIIGNLSSPRSSSQSSGSSNSAPDQSSSSTSSQNSYDQTTSTSQNCQSSVNSEMQHAFPAIYGRRQSRMTPYNPRNVYTSRPVPPSRKTPRRQLFIRNVVFLKKGEDLIPRGRKRELLFDEGRIANLVAIDTSMTDVELYNLIEERFLSLIDNTYPYPRYQYDN